MKKKITLVLFVAIALALSMFIFAACKEKKNDSSPSDTQTSSIQSSSIASSSEEEDSSSSAEPQHIHGFLPVYDGENHWRECDCGEKTDIAAHTLAVKYDTDGHWRECACGYRSEKSAHGFANGVCSVCGLEVVTLEYDFSGEESALAGYAQGTVTLTKASAFPLDAVYRLYWGDEKGRFDKYLPVSELTVEDRVTELSFSIEENVVIPDGANMIFAYMAASPEEKYVASCSVPENKELKETPEHVFASISDVHCNYPQGKNYLTNAFNEFIAAGVEFVFNSGDIGESVADYAKYKAAIERSRYQGLIFSCIGNHDQTDVGRSNFFKYAIYDGSFPRWIALDEAEDYFANEYKGGLNVTVDYAGDADNVLYYYSVVIENNAVIFMDQQLNSTGDTPNQDNFSVAELDFVENFLRKYAGVHTIGDEFKYERYNLFIIEHSPIEALKIGDKFIPGYGGAIKIKTGFENNRRFLELLKEFNEAVWMSGHTHVQYDAGITYLDKLYDNGGKLTDTPIAHAVHNSSLAQPRYYEGNSMIFYNDYRAASQGYICYQYSDRLVYEAHVFKPFTPDNEYYDETTFDNTVDAAHSYVIPLYTLEHALPEPPEPPENYAFAENGIMRKGTFTFADAENGLKVDFATDGDRFELKLGNQTKAYDNGLWLSFYIDTQITAIDIGGCLASTGNRYTINTIDLTSMGSGYGVTAISGSVKYLQLPISMLYDQRSIEDLSIRFFNPVGGLSFTIADMYITKAPSVNYAFASNGIMRKGTFAFADTENGLKVDFATADDRFEVALGNQTDAYESELWLSFYIDTQITAIDVGGCLASTGNRYTINTIDLSNSGAQYTVKRMADGKILIQISLNMIYNEKSIADFSIRFFNPVGGLSFTLSKMYIGEYISD